MRQGLARSEVGGAPQRQGTEGGKERREGRHGGGGGETKAHEELGKGETKITETYKV